MEKLSNNIDVFRSINELYSGYSIKLAIPNCHQRIFGALLFPNALDIATIYTDSCNCHLDNALGVWSTYQYHWPERIELKKAILNYALFTTADNLVTLIVIQRGFDASNRALMLKKYHEDIVDIYTWSIWQGNGLFESF